MAGDRARERLKKMGEILRRKKKGRPSKADLAARLAASSAPQPTEKRHIRRRSFRCKIIDFGEDYLDDDFEVAEEEEDGGCERRRQKKLKLVLKLPTGRPSCDGGDLVSRTRRPSRRDPDSDDGEEEEENDDAEEEEARVVKKRKINGYSEVDAHDNASDEERGRKSASKKGDSVPGIQVDTKSGTPLPEKKQLELILDKLQKKDTYGVYAEPVDPEELPDYHDIIEHPMDFATVRKKLANGSYCTLELFEADVFLICSNAMKYNAPDTVYYKQARAIKELSEKKFCGIRNDIELYEKGPKSEHKEISALIVKKQTKKPICSSTHEPLGSGFSSGATLATSDAQNTFNAVEVGTLERPSNNDGFLAGGTSSIVENSLEKVEDSLSGKGLLPKCGKKPSVVDENHRATYGISNQPVDRFESRFMPLEGEKKQLVSVGWQGDHSYAQSLARFAAALGPVAWRTAAKRIEQSLPPGLKFGRGWVGEYEPLPMQTLAVETRMQNEDPFSSKLKSPANLKHDKFHQNSLPLSDNPISANGFSKPPILKTSVDHCLAFRNSIGTENKVATSEDSNCPAAVNQKPDLHIARNPFSRVAEVPISCLVEKTMKNCNSSPSFPSNHQNSNGVHLHVESANGKVVNNSVDMNRTISSPLSIASVQVVLKQEQRPSDPTQTTRISTEQALKQQNGSYLKPSLLSPRGDNRSNAAATVNLSMNRSQVSADLSYNNIHNNTQDLHQRVLGSQGENPISRAMHFQAFVMKTAKVFSEPSRKKAVVFPHLTTTELPRFQLQSSLWGLTPHTQQRQKQDKLPPDLNVAFPSSADNQQPDLALQL